MPTLLAAEPPYDGPRLLGFLGAHAVPGVEHWDGTTFTRSLRTPDGVVVVSMTAAQDGILVDGTMEPAVLQRLRHLMATTASTAEAERHLAVDVVIGASVLARPGLHAAGSADHGETLVRTVVGQQVSLKGARAALGKISAALGEPLRRPRAGVTTTFPSMAALAAHDPMLLPMPRARARTVVACAAAVVDERGLPPRQRLLELPGVGPWTADYVDLRCHQDPDVFLPTDLAVRRVLERAGHDGSPRAAAERASAWAPHRSTALMHLWATYLEPDAASVRAAIVMGRPSKKP